MLLYRIEDCNRIPDAIDSKKEAHLVLCPRRSARIPGCDPSVSASVYYPRVKKMKNGRYLMLMQDGRVSASIYYTTGDDGLHYAPRKPLFSSRMTVREDGAEDKLCFASGDAVVLADGTVLAFCSWRYNKGYTLDAANCGLLMRRSTDNGESWSEPREIYRGRNWEPFALERPDGEIQVYFSHTAPKFYYDKTVRCDSHIRTSSGSALIRSFDGGESWVPNVTEPPYAADRVTQNYVETMANGTKIFTNQMPVAVSLHNGDILLATESDMMKGRFMLTLSYSADNWARPLGIDEDGPTDKRPAFDFGAGPYVAQFPSGETVLGYNTENRYFLRLGDSRGRGFDRIEAECFGGTNGYWGSILVEDSHTLLVSMPEVNEVRREDGKLDHCENNMMLERYLLNHEIRALPYAAWQDGGDALYLAADGAECVLRAARDGDTLRLRADRIGDGTLTLSVTENGKPLALSAVANAVPATAADGTAGEVDKWTLPLADALRLAATLRAGNGTECTQSCGILIAD